MKPFVEIGDGKGRVDSGWQCPDEGEEGREAGAVEPSVPTHP